MKQKKYKITLYILLGIAFLSLVGTIVLVIVKQALETWGSILLAVMFIALISAVLLKLFTASEKDDKELYTKTKACVHCNSINDDDAKFCKMCGAKFDEDTKA